MPDNRGSIRANIVTTLNAINGVSPYEVDVGTVDLFWRVWSEIDGVTSPIIGVAMGAATCEYAHTQRIRVTQRVYLWVHLRGLAESTLISTMDSLIDDIVYALNRDTTRGAYATKTSVVGWETDEADNEGRNGTLSARIDVDVVYDRTTGKS